MKSMMNTSMLVAFVLVAVVAMLGLVSSVRSAPPQRAKPNEVADFMQLKLRHSQEVLEGLAVEDFDQIAKNAQDLSLLSQAASWNVLQTEEYLQQSGEFRRTADALTKAAKEKNLDAAAIRYVELTMKCVHCHKYVRGVRMVRLP
ncbi:MAG: hypothetical protein KF708_20945 [Pirellulales bacterium]|nr:hypothetical protein [Pirellulales bacterium]